MAYNSFQLCLVFSSVVLGRSFPQGDLETASSYKKPQDGYFQYVNVPAVKEYEFGWNRGNPNHYISRYEQNKDHRFRTRVSALLMHVRSLDRDRVEQGKCSTNACHVIR